MNGKSRAYEYEAAWWKATWERHTETRNFPDPEQARAWLLEREGLDEWLIRKRSPDGWRAVASGTKDELA